MLPGTIGGDRDRVAEQHCTGVAGEVGMGVEVVGDLPRLGAHRVPIVAAVGMELQVGHVGPVAFQHFHSFQGGGDVARGAQVVAVQVQRVRQAHLIDHPGQAGNDRGGGRLAVAVDGLMELLGILAPLPCGYAARVDRLHAIDLRR